MRSRTARRKKAVSKSRTMGRRKPTVRKRKHRRYAGVGKRTAAALAKRKPVAARRAPVRARKTTYKVKPKPTPASSGMSISASAYLSMY